MHIRAYSEMDWVEGVWLITSRAIRLVPNYKAGRTVGEDIETFDNLRLYMSARTENSGHIYSTSAWSLLYGVFKHSSK